MAVVTANLSFTFPENPQDLLVEAFCGKFNYPLLVSTVSGLIPNPQSSGDFARTLISGFCLDVISSYNLQRASVASSYIATSGVTTVLAASGFDIGLLA